MLEGKVERILQEVIQLPLQNPRPFLASLFIVRLFVTGLIVPIVGSHWLLLMV